MKLLTKKLSGVIRRWSLVALTVVGISSILSGCAASSSPITTQGEGSFEPETSVADTVVEDTDQTAPAEDCVAQPVSEDDAPTEISDVLGPGPYMGTGGIWTAAITEDEFQVLDSDPASFDAFVKVPWFRVGEHDLEVVLQDPEGNTPAGVFESSPEAYPAEGVLPSTLTFDSPGCWTVRVTYGPDTLEFSLWVPSA
jgi:hypothetical protein